MPISHLDRNGDYAHGGVHYLDLIDQTQKKQVKIARETQSRLINLFEDVAKELGEKASRAGEKTLTRRFALDYQKEIQSVLTNMRQAQFDISVSGIKKASENGVFTQQKIFEHILSNVDSSLNKSFTGVLSRVPTQALNEILSGKIYTDGAGLSKRIWANSKSFERDIGYVIEKGMLSKKSAIELAQDIEKYVNGSAVTNASWGKIYPGLASKKCSYEAQRLALTSISHAYQLGTIRSAQQNPYVEGVLWLTSNSHRATCELCLWRAKQNDFGLGEGIFPVNNVPLDHPNGLCTLAPYIPMELDAIGDELAAWVSGANNPKLDNWFNKMIDNGGESGKMSIKTQTNSELFADKISKQVGMSPEYQQAAIDRFENGTELAQKVFLKYVPDDSVVDYNVTHGSYYYRLDKKIRLDSIEDMKYDEIKAITYFHEHGHLIDNIEDGYMQSILASDFRSALEYDYNSCISSYMKNNKVGIKHAREAISQEICGFENLAVSDIFSGLSEGKCQGWFSHDKNYWKKDPSKVQSEAFAEMYSAHFSPSLYRQLEKYCPRSFEYFNKLLEGLMQ